MSLSVPVAPAETIPPLRRASGDFSSARNSLTRNGRILLLILLCFAPFLIVLSRTAEARRDIAYWDELDTAVAFMVKLKEGAGTANFLQELFSVNNGHRMVTSRLLFAGSYWLSGTINFALIDYIGIGAIVGACALLVLATPGRIRRLYLAVPLAWLLFQLEHYENFLWSGSSIDHFLVILLAAGTITALARGTTTGLVLASLLGILATYTLAHGLAVWTAGAGLLGVAGRRRALAAWVLLGALVATGFISGISTGGGQVLTGIAAQSPGIILRYWLSILGSVPALGHAVAAPWLGFLLLVGTIYVLRTGALRRERAAVGMLHFCLAAAGMIAVGRAQLSGGVVYSRYYVLSAVAWSLVIFLASIRHTDPRRPWRLLCGLLPGLVAFNFAANREFSDETDSWLSCRDIATVNYKHYGVDGHGPFNLHPDPRRSTQLLQTAERLGIYRLGPVCFPVTFPTQARESGRITYYLEEISASARSAAVRGWAGIPGQIVERGGISLILRSATKTLVYSTVTVPRADVPRATGEAGWTNAGFHFALRRQRLSAGDYQIGLLINGGEGAELVMTGQRLVLKDTDRASGLTGDN